ncbi:MAG TPA: protein kinase [Candidatus Acidoferrales bacterium]|nr:protein kinase [Candidatus Acidoferrales bacterium]
MIGQTLGHYRIEAQLGAGGMGVVYRARDERLGRAVALKVLLAGKQADEGARARLLREARAASSLNHPHICHIYEVGEAEGQAYIAMELVEGQPLNTRIPADGLPVDAVLRYGAQIADALAHAHERNIVHRDLKTANVVLTPEGRAKVLDFGLAKQMEEELLGATRSKGPLTQEGAVAGTLHYIAPEVLRGGPADARSDIWALGVVLHEMASGRLPFEGKTGYELSSAILHQPQATLPARVPAGLRAIIQRCLAKEPGERYRTAGEIRAALEALQTDSAVAARIVPPPARRRWQLALMWVGGVALLALVAGIVASLVTGVPILVQLGVVKTAPERRLSTGGKPSLNSEANEYFEKGVLFLSVQLDIPRARQMLDKALELDPHFAEARSWRAYTYLVAIDSGYSNDASGLYLAEEELRRALQDDPSAGHPHSVLAGIYLYQGRKELAPAEAEKALAANPDDLEARTWLLGYHWLNGNYAAAEALVKESMRLAPLNLYARIWYGGILREKGETAGAVRELIKVLEQDPQYLYALVFLTQTYMDRGELRQARQTLEHARPGDRGNYWIRVAWTLLLAREGNRVEALKEMDPEVVKYLEASPWHAVYGAEIHATLGEKEKALEWLERGMRFGDERGEWFQRDPMLANLRDDPRFKQILKSITYRRQQRQPAAR